MREALRDNRLKFQIFWIGFSSIFMLVGLVVLFFGVQDLLKANRSANWPATHGNILSAEFVTHPSDDDSGPTYSAEIHYQYQVSGDLHTGDKIRITDLSYGDPQVARQTLARYPVGQQVSVYYNPNDPSEAVLEPGVQGSSWFLPGLGTAFAVLGFIFVLIGVLMNVNRSIEA